MRDLMYLKGDTERQATLRDEAIKRSKRRRKDNYVLKIHSVLKPHMKLLDIGCGTAHIIDGLSTRYKNVIFVGLDVSPAMLRIAKSNTAGSLNVMLVEGDGLMLPFRDRCFDIVISRLAEYSLREAYRILKKEGFFLEYGLGLEASREILEFFRERVEKENFFFPDDLEEWKSELCKQVMDASFAVDSIDEYKETEYYPSEERLMDLIEMMPLVKNFNREMDGKIIDKLAKKYGGEKGIGIT